LTRVNEATKLRTGRWGEGAAAVVLTAGKSSELKPKTENPELTTENREQFFNHD